MMVFKSGWDGSLPSAHFSIFAALSRAKTVEDIAVMFVSFHFAGPSE